MASQLHDLRRQLSVQKMTTTVNLCIRRKLVVAMSRWKQVCYFSILLEFLSPDNVLGFSLSNRLPSNRL
jgi:hypothetical protein